MSFRTRTSDVAVPSQVNPDARGGLRLTLAAVAALLVAVPFALLLVLVVNSWGPLQRLDVRLDNNLSTFAFHHASYVSVLRAVTNVGSPTTIGVVSALVAVALLVRRQPRLAVWLLVTVFGSELLSRIVKQAVGRERPPLPHPLAHALGTSFPSGHALGAVVGVGALLLVGLPYAPRSWRPPLIGLGILAVLAVGFSRLGLSVHYLSDVLGGYVLGAAWLAATTAAFSAWRRDIGRAPRPVTQGLEPAAPERT